MPSWPAAWGSEIGDTLTVNVLGRELMARIANLREIDWTSLGLNFAIVLSPGTLDGAPQTHIATARTAPGSEAALARAVSQRFPNVSAISVRDALANLAGVIDAIAAALTAIAAVALAAGAWCSPARSLPATAAGSMMRWCSRCWARRGATSPALISSNTGSWAWPPRCSPPGSARSRPIWC